MCVLLGYGADAICPYLVFELAATLRSEGVIDADITDDVLFKVRHSNLLAFLSLVLSYCGHPYSVLPISCYSSELCRGHGTWHF